MNSRSKYEKKLLKIVSGNLDNIYKISRDIAKDWDKNTIPLTTLEVIINKSRPSVNTGSNEVDAFNTRYNKLLDALLRACRQIAKRMDSKSISIEQIKNGINIIKDGFKQGINTSETAST